MVWSDVVLRLSERVLRDAFEFMSTLGKPPQIVVPHRWVQLTTLFGFWKFDLEGIYAMRVSCLVKALKR